MEDEDSKNKCHHTFIFGVRRKAMYLYTAVNIALKKKGENNLTWRQICDEAVEKVKEFEDDDNLPASEFSANT